MLRVNKRCECKLFAHSAQIAQLPDRSLVVVWFEGPPEGQAGVSIVASHLGMRHNQCFFLSKFNKIFFGYFDPENIFLDNENR